MEDAEFSSGSAVDRHWTSPPSPWLASMSSFHIGDRQYACLEREEFGIHPGVDAPDKIFRPPQLLYSTWTIGKVYKQNTSREDSKVDYRLVSSWRSLKLNDTRLKIYNILVGVVVTLKMVRVFKIFNPVVSENNFLSQLEIFFGFVNSCLTMKSSRK